MRAMDSEAERIEKNGMLLAVIVGATCVPTRTVFYSPEDALLQMGNVVHKAGSSIRPHTHLEAPRMVDATQEVLVV